MSKDEDAGTPDSSVRELEALERQDRKATEQLLSGFDRPGRTPRAPRAKSRDFVDYYSGRSAPIPDAPPPSSRREDSGPHDRATVLVPRRTQFRATMTWIVAVVGMMLFGVTIAVLATPQTPPSSSLPPPPVVSPTMTPTSATTITSANPRPVDTGVEPAEQPSPDNVVVAPSPGPGPKKVAPATTITSGAPSAPTIKTAPREDFIRDM